jgi:two-component system, LytTR family, response regulator
MVSMLPDPITVLVVDDEHLARERLRVLLSGEPDMLNAGECSNGLDALAAITRVRPELVFLDVQMPDLDGLGVIAALSEEEAPEIIFVTAHNAYMERAFEIHAVDYLRKPYTNVRFASALAHARKRIHARRSERSAVGGREPSSRDPQFTPILASRHELSQDPRVAVQDSRTGFWRIVRADEIDWIEADGSSGILVHMAAETLHCRKTLSGIAKTLDPRVFLRIHRSYIVNATHIHQVKPLQKGEYAVHLSGNVVLDSGRTFRDVVERFLGEPVRTS